ncbi:unnamed protein product [Coregonus sp. 'balchen']|nr:unnamed protein product [Coregonus sp. 'balchen']
MSDILCIRDTPGLDSPIGHRREMSPDMALVGVRASYHRILNQIELLLPGKLRPIYNHPAAGVRASYHRILNQIELKLPAKLRPFYNHPAGVIWSRYSLVIIPKNWGLFFVNGFLGLAGANQLVRIWMYQQEVKKQQDEKAQIPII